MKLFISIYFTLLFSIQVFADNNVVDVERISSRKKIVSILYPDNHNWVYERFLVETNKLQESMDRRVFGSKKQALDYIKPNRLSTRSMSFLNTGTVTFREVSTEDYKEKIWQDTNRWSAQWERKYSQWFRENVTKDFFVKYNIATDCADAAIAFRWIFSRINSLPAGQTLAGTSILFTNRSFKNKWKKYQRSSVWHKDKVFMASLRYLVRNTYTHSLQLDSYPVAITPEHLSEGAYRLTLSRTSGHTVLIHRQNVNGIPLSSLNSTVPLKVRSLSESIFIPSRIEERKEGGLVKHLWIAPRGDSLIKVKPRNMPGYSLEQYDPEFGKDNFSIAILKRIDPHFDALKVYKSILKSTVDAIKQRVGVVQEGYDFCRANDCSPGTQNYEDWSTPSRDKQLKEKMTQEEELFSSFSAVSNEIIDVRPDLIENKNIDIMGELYSYEFIKTIWEKSYFNSDPRASLERRWALSAKDFSSSVVEKISKYNETLMDKISQSNCQSQDSCPKFSKKWNREQTIFERGVIKTYLVDLFNYCEWKKMPCREYFANTIKDISIANYTFHDYVKFIFNGSFDPHSSTADKAGYRSDIDSALFIKPQYVGMTKSYLVSSDILGFNYTSVDTKIRESLPIEGKILTSAKNSNSILFISKENEIFYLNIDNGKPVSIYTLKEKEKLKRVYIHGKQVFLATNMKFEYISFSSEIPKTILSDSLNDAGTNDNPGITTSIISGDKFYLSNGRILYLVNLTTEEITKKIIPLESKEDYFKIVNVSDKHIYLENRKTDEGYISLIYNKANSELLKAIKKEKYIAWLFGSDIYKYSTEDSRGFYLKRFNENQEDELLMRCEPCSGHTNGSNLEYTKNDISELSYWNGSELVKYKLTHNGVISSYKDYVIEKTDNVGHYVFSKKSGKTSKINFSGYKYSWMTDIGLVLEYHASFNDDELPMSYDVDYLFTENGSYIPLDYAISLSYPDGTSEDVIKKYEFIGYNELYSSYKNEGVGVITNEVDQLNNFVHKGGLFKTGDFVLWLSLLEKKSSDN